MRTSRVILITLALMLLMMGTASAAVSVSDSSRIITITDNTVQNVSSLYDHLVGVYGEPGVNSRIEKTGDTTYDMKYGLKITNADDIFYINNSDVTYMRMGASDGASFLNGRAFQGRIQIENTEIYFYDFINNQDYDTTRMVTSGELAKPLSYLYAPMNNVILHNMHSMNFGLSNDGISEMVQ